MRENECGIYVNADDWGRSLEETDLILKLGRMDRLSAASAMVFMADSERAAGLAGECPFEIGLHLNFSESFSALPEDSEISIRLERVKKYLTANKGNYLRPALGLREDFEFLVEKQIEEFVRLYGYQPTKFDGHLHMHLSSSAFLAIWSILSPGSLIRRHFTFEQGEKSVFNRAYRGFFDRILRQRFSIWDGMYSLQDALRDNKLPSLIDRAETSGIELMIHPIFETEIGFLFGEEFPDSLTQRLIRRPGKWPVNLDRGANTGISGGN